MRLTMDVIAEAETNKKKEEIKVKLAKINVQIARSKAMENVLKTETPERTKQFEGVLYTTLSQTRKLMYRLQDLKLWIIC